MNPLKTLALSLSFVVLGATAYASEHTANGQDGTEDCTQSQVNEQERSEHPTKVSDNSGYLRK